MKMKDRLPGIRSVVDDHPVPFLKTTVARERSRDFKNPCEDRPMGTRHVRRPGDMLAGNKQQMAGGLRMQVLKYNQLIVLMNDGRRNRTRYDSAEYTVFSHRNLPGLIE
jgi:hypothetical protein